MKVRQNISYIHVQTNRPSLHSLRRICLTRINTDIAGIRIITGHPPERIFNNTWGVIPDSQFQIQHPAASVPPYKIRLAALSGIPSLILHKGIIAPEVHRHRCTANRAMRNQFRRNFHGGLM